jgi:molybdopterin converting factor small subunit
VRLFVNGEALERDAVDTPVSEADHVQFLAAVAGG